MSELRKVNLGRCDPGVLAWSERVEIDELAISVVTVLELEIGILRIERRDPAQGATLRSWMTNQVVPAFHGRVLPISIEVATRCARFHIPDPKPDRDALIAAIADIHQLTLVTRNVRDFQSLPIDFFNPWS